ncbi:MAG: ABC transporter substrate-binding protein [Desulfobacterales bacterium]|jgi:branched-chain amino acid transport system substrate-binding protein
MRKIIILFCLIEALSLSSLAGEQVKIGAVFSKTGIAAIHNAPLIEMIKLAAEEINNEGGLLGHPVHLIMLDNRSTPIGSKLAAEEAVRMGASAVIGAHWSSHSLALAPILQKAGIPMISPGSTNPKVTQIGNYIFRVCFIDSFQGQAMARFAYDNLGARKAVVLKNIDEEYSIKLAEYFMDAFRRIGGKVLLDGSYRGKAVDFSDVLEATVKLAPDVVYVPGYTRDSGLLIKQAVSMGVKATFLGGDAWDEIYKYGGEAIDGSYHSAPWHPDVPFPKSIHLKKIYRKKYDMQIENMSAPLAYDAFMVLADAIKRAGTLDEVRLRKAIAETNGFQAATGLISFDENGDPLNKEVIIIKLDKGKPVYYKAIKP